MDPNSLFSSKTVWAASLSGKGIWHSIIKKNITYQAMNPAVSNSSITHLKNLLVRFSWEPWLLIAAGALMTNISWLKWPDLVIDFGEQAYIPWRFSEGG
jgi:hypothetical protein